MIRNLIISFMCITTMMFAAAGLGWQEEKGLDTEIVSFDGQCVVRMTLNSVEDLKFIQDISNDIWTEHFIPGGNIDFRIPRSELKILDEAGLDYEIMIPDIQQLIDRQKDEPVDPEADWFSDYKRYSEVITYMQDLVNLRPDLAEMINLGPSLRGNTIWAIHITGPGNDPVRPGLFIHGTMHAREWITTMANCYIADTLIKQYDTDPSIKNMVDTRDWYIVPISNPDGYDYTWTNNRMWRKNRRSNYGVDLNRNWDYHWGGPGSSGSTNSEIYRGESPFSEPETQALSNFMIDTPNIVAHLDIHSYSQLVLQPWGWTRELPPEHDTLDALGADMMNAIESVNGTSWRHGPIFTTIYPASGGSCDWAYGDRRIWGFSYELRDKGQYGFLLPKSQIIPASEETLAGVKVLANADLEPLMVMDTSWLQRGQPAQFTAIRATPGSLVHFFYSLGGTGSTYYSDLGVYLDLQAPVLVAKKAADNRGVAVYNFTVPRLPRMVVVWLQAAETGRTSSVRLTQVN